MITALKQQAGIHSSIVGNVIDAVAEAIKADEDLEIYTSGANNILKYPELADNQKASELINTFEEKQLLNELVVDRLSDENNTGIQIYIGDETPVKTMKDCSVVTATYELEEGMKGTINCCHLNSFNKVLLANHIKTCVINDIKAGKEETVDELLETLQKLMK